MPAWISHGYVVAWVAAALSCAERPVEREIGMPAETQPAETQPAATAPVETQPAKRTPGEATRCDEPSPGPGYVCVQDCPPAVASAGDPEPGFSWLTAEQAERRASFGCPICLPPDAAIDTPTGPVPVASLTAGSWVFAVDDEGRRVATQVLHAMRAEAPASHRLAVVELADGRVVRASPGHPVADGRALGELRVGDSLDGSAVVATRRIPHRGHTHDIVLPHGRYVSDGVVLRSSLARE